MDPKIIELREKQQEHVAAARAILDQLDGEVTESRAAELEKQHDKHMADHDELEKKIQRYERLAEAEDRAIAPDPRRPREPNSEGGSGEAEAVTPAQAFTRAMCFGVGELNAEERSALMELRTQLAPEQRALSAGTDATGGYTVPEGFQAEIIKSMQMYGPMLNPAVTRVLDTASGNRLPWPTLDDTSNKGALLSENTQATEQDLAFGEKELDAYTYTSKIVRVSLQLLQDSAFNIEQLLRECFGERIGRIANEHLTTGTGTSQPNGILTASTLGDTAAGAAAITLDDVINLYHSVDPSYRMLPSCAFMFHDNILKALRKIKDSEGNYIWQPASARTGAPAQLLEQPYVINQDMTSTITTTDKTMLFGAMEKYVVRRVLDFTMLRLNERYADYLQAGFIAFNRIDGELVDTAAVKHLQQA